ncbi:MAG: alpha-xylosidase [Bifidobacteriaceae bacterium]|jgi:alpha-D-xyloside xylohydrolase|nr:alpha-xylosidase [Bifidobacteriaceae bacterium]
MKFTDGVWMFRDGVTDLHPIEVDSAHAADGLLTVYAATARITDRADTLNRGLVTLRLSSPAEGIIRVEAEHWSGGRPPTPAFPKATDPAWRAAASVTASEALLDAGALSAHLPLAGPFRIDFRSAGKLLSSSDAKSLAFLDVAGTAYAREQLALGVGERVYGLGERFGPLAKNGQSIEIWNRDGGTASEQAYKNVPFYLTSGGYGVFVDHPERVSFEIASENVERAQFSVPGQRLAYYVMAGPTPKDVLRRYTELTGRPPKVPAWSYGPWLSTSFTANYDERTVIAAVDKMAELELPLAVFHFDCFWMREYEWCGFEWDSRAFPDPAGLLARLHAKGVRVCVWINPYIGQRAPSFAEAAAQGFLLRLADGSVWQTDLWQAGMGIVDFTNPAARDWYADKIRVLLGQGVDCLKSDFGERIPVDGVAWFDGSDPARMHNYYSYLYNQTVFDALREHRGDGEAILFGRSATAGGQQFPAHWSGDCDSTLPAMAETLRGGLSLGLSGFGYWSHDIGGFEGTPGREVFIRWTAFGLLSSHSRFHGSTTLRVPWAFGPDAVEVVRKYSKLKLRLLPYLGMAARDARAQGTPILRAMVLEFPDDRSTWDVDTQYLLGPNLLVAPVFNPISAPATSASTGGPAAGQAAEDHPGTAPVDFYVPAGTWTSLLDGATVTGPGWVRQRHGLDSLPLLVRPNTVLPLGARDDTAEYDWSDGLTLAMFELADGHDSTLVIPASEAGTGAEDATFQVRREGETITVTTDSAKAWAVLLGTKRHAQVAGTDAAHITLS